MNLILFLMSLLMLKHTIMDFCMQRAFMFRDKHIYGAKGGVVHALTHSAGTAVVLCYFLDPLSLLLISLFDGVAHYHIDHAKSVIQNLKKYAQSDVRYWVLFGADQYLHFLTYVAIIAVLI